MRPTLDLWSPGAPEPLSSPVPAHPAQLAHPALDAPPLLLSIINLLWTRQE